MRTILHVVDAFTDKPFAGNPAAVCLLDGPADETWMKLLAREMHLEISRKTDHRAAFTGRSPLYRRSPHADKPAGADHREVINPLVGRRA